MQQVRKRARSKPSVARLAPLISETDLARLGGGQIAYIRVMSTAQAKKLFPSVRGLPAGIDLFSLHAADGTPIALTDSRQAAIGHAMDGELQVASLH